MDLTTLSKSELNDLFMKVNTEYINLCKGDPQAYIKKDNFLQISNQLTAVLNELVRRREIKAK